MPEDEVEKDWDYMGRVASWVYEAFHRIPRTREAMGALFDTPVTRWEGDDEVDLTNKALFGLIQLEIEGIQECMEGLAPRTGWRVLFRQKDAILYQSAAGEVVKVPVEIAENIVRGVPFEGEVTAHGRLLEFSVGSEVLAEIPRSLVVALRESRSGEGSGEGGTGGGGGEAEPAGGDGR